VILLPVILRTLLKEASWWTQHFQEILILLIGSLISANPQLPLSGYMFCQPQVLLPSNHLKQKIAVMYRPILFFLLLFGPLWGSAQVITVSEPISIRNDVAYELIGELEGRILLLQDQASTFVVRAFDDRMKEVWDKEIELDARRPTILGVLGRTNDFSILYYYRNEGDYHLKLHTYDPAANLVDSVTLKNLGPFVSLPRFDVIRSEDRSKLLIYRLEGFGDITAMVIDMEDRRVSWEASFSPDNMVFDRDFQQVLVSNEGEMFFILNFDNRKAKREAHRYSVIVGSEAIGPDPLLITLTMGGVLSYDALFSLDNLNRTLVAGGMYFEENPNRAEGHFFLNYDLETRGNPILTFEPFGETFVINFMGQRLNRKNKGVIETTIQQIVHRRDGGVLIIGERFRTFERQSAASRAAYRYSGQFIIDYYYDEMFVISVHPDGQTHWKAVLPKKQYSQDDDAIFSSYFLATTPTSLRILFNDQIKQENTVSEYVIGGDGSFDRNAVMSTQHQNLRLRVRDAIQTSANELVIPSERRNRLKLVRVLYE
jgi:hypothetical protein